MLHVNKLYISRFNLSISNHGFDYFGDEPDEIIGLLKKEEIFLVLEPITNGTTKILSQKIIYKNIVGYIVYTTKYHDQAFTEIG